MICTFHPLGSVSEACNFTKINIPPWVFFTFFKLCKWYQIARSSTYVISKIDMALHVMDDIPHGNERYEASQTSRPVKQ